MKTQTNKDLKQPKVIVKGYVIFRAIRSSKKIIEKVKK